MIGSLSRSRYPQSPRRWALQMAHVLGAGVGGVLAVLLARLVAAEVGVPVGQRETLPIVAGALLAAAALEASIGHKGVPSPSVQVPKDWRYGPATVWAPAFGLLLGLTYVTRNSSWVVFVSHLAVALALASLLALVMYGVVFGFARAALVFVKAEEWSWRAPSAMWSLSAVPLLLVGLLSGQGLV